MKIIVGLGNPGKEYETTRHNMGFMTVDRLAKKFGIDIIDLKHKGMCGKGIISGEKVMLVKPQTYMNNSGECVREVMDYYKVLPEDILIIYDDIDLDPGQLRIRKNGSAGSHNGMKSVIKHMGTQVFPRVRVGVGAKPEGWDLADYVLSRISPDADREIIKGTEDAAEAVECIISKGIDDAMNLYNRHKDTGAEEKAI